MNIPSNFTTKNFTKTNTGKEYTDFTRYIQAKIEFLDNYTFSPHSDWDDMEYYIIKRFVKKLSALVRPHILAEFLGIDTAIIFNAIEKGDIPYFKYENIYTIETDKLIPFLRKHYF